MIFTIRNIVISNATKIPNTKAVPYLLASLMSSMATHNLLATKINSKMETQSTTAEIMPVTWKQKQK